MHPDVAFFKNRAESILKHQRGGSLGPQQDLDMRTSYALATTLGGIENHQKWLMELSAEVGKMGRKPERPKHEFSSLGAQLQAVAAATRGDGAPDWRLDFQRRGALGANETLGEFGGFAVQADFSDRLLQAISYESEVASRCTEIPISAAANEVRLPRPNETSRADGSRWGGVRSRWKNEAEPAQTIYSDLVIDGSDDTKATSAANRFTAEDVGITLVINASTGFTAQRATTCR